MSKKETIAIIGGGIAGLAAAYRLSRRAERPAVTLIEGTAQLGGKIRTERAGELLFEAGPDCFLSRKPGGIALCESLGLHEALIGRDPAQARTFVRRHGQLHRLPPGLSGMIPADPEGLRASTLLSEAGRQRVAREIDLPPAPGSGDETVGAFIRRRLGDEAYENLVEPLMGGIYAADADQLSLAATFPALRRLEQEHGSLLRALGNPAPAGAAAYPPFVSFAGGMASLVERLVEALEGVEIRLGRPVRAIVPHGTGYRLRLAGGEEIEAAGLIGAAPAHVMAPLLQEVDDALAAELAAIPYVSTALVSLVFDAETVGVPLDGYGYVIPRVEHRSALACTLTSNKWPGRAPEGTHLVRLYFGRAGGPDVTRWSDETLLQAARTELRETLGVRATPRSHRIHRWPHAMPQYHLGHPARLERIEQRLAARPTLALAGAAYRGIGIPDCIISGERAAGKVAKSLLTEVI